MTPRLPILLSALVAGAFVFPSISAHAQCRPGKESHEARLLAFYSAPIAFSTDLGASSLRRGMVRISAEGVAVPAPSSEIEQTGTCFTAKSERTRLSPFFGRPRLAIGLGAGFVAEGSYLPPVTISEATPNLGSVALSRLTPLRGVNVLARMHATFGTVKGAITCASRALQMTDPSAPCYGTKESRDTFHPTMWGAEFAAVTPDDGRRLMLLAGVGVNTLSPRFRVGFTDAAGRVDNTRIEVNLTRATLLGGVALRVTSRCNVGGQVYSVPKDVTTVRAIAGCRIGSLARH